METRNETSQPQLRGQTSANKSESDSPPLRYVSFCFKCCTFPTRPQSHICLRTHTYCYQVVWANGLVPNILIRRPITAGCPVRVMRADGKANFRNGYESSNMGEPLIYTFVFFTSFLTIVLHIMYSNRGSKARGFWKC